MTVAFIRRVDRRSPSRLVTPTCFNCGTDTAVVALIRTRQFVYFRCEECREWLPKSIPAMQLGHGLVAQLSD